MGKREEKGGGESDALGKRPGSVVSREFQPGKNQQQKASTMWRKRMEMQSQSPPHQQQQQPQHIYGFVPFKGGSGSGGSSLAFSNSVGAANPASHIYGTAIRSATNNHNEYLNSTYAPPQLIRQNYRPVEPGIQQHPPASAAAASRIGSRPGSDLGMYKAAPSRCHSYTSLPRPEHGLAELSLSAPSFGPNIQSHIPDNNNMIQFRPHSALSNSRSPGRKNSAALPPAYFGPNVFNTSQIDFGNGNGMEGGQHFQLASWSTISLSSWLTIVFGSAIFCLSAIRLYWRADIARGSQELFYGISAICTGIVGVLASQYRSYCMLVAAFLHFSINAIFFVPFISGILPFIPLISSVATSSLSGSNKMINMSSEGRTKELPVVDTGLVMLSLLQLAAAFTLLLYGCRAFGRGMRRVESIHQQRINKAGNGEGEGSGSGRGRDEEGMRKL